jgi:hypothetical protein
MVRLRLGHHYDGPGGYVLIRPKNRVGHHYPVSCCSYTNTNTINTQYGVQSRRNCVVFIDIFFLNTLPVAPDSMCSLLAGGGIMNPVLCFDGGIGRNGIGIDSLVDFAAQLC